MEFSTVKYNELYSDREENADFLVVYNVGGTRLGNDSVFCNIFVTIIELNFSTMIRKL